jgi:hypothetical protein
LSKMPCMASILHGYKTANPFRSKRYPNRHDVSQLELVLDEIIINHTDTVQHLCADKGYTLHRRTCVESY